ncbi:BnaA09g14250D, partial [Brassica napus]
MSETRSDWSKLCPDLLRSIFGRLIISKDFYRSRTVCSDWYSVSTTCKGDVTWLCHERIECAYVTYKDGKLYVYTFDRCIEILDLSGDLLVQGNPYRNHPFHIDDSHPKSVVITSSGELLIVMLIFGHGVTIKAPIKGINGWGIKGDTICFGGDEEDIFPSSDRRNRTTNCGVFDLATDTQTSLDVPFFKSFWFVPEYEIVDHET